MVGVVLLPIVYTLASLLAAYLLSPRYELRVVFMVGLFVTPLISYATVRFFETASDIYK